MLVHTIELTLNTLLRIFNYIPITPLTKVRNVITSYSIHYTKLYDVASAPSFFEQHKVIDAASEMLCKIFGDKIGKHARTAIGVSALPMNATVEIAGIFEINY